MSKQKPVDAAFEIVEQQMLDRAVQEKKMKPMLDAQLKKVLKIDNFIEWNEKKIKSLEEDKQRELSKMGDLMDLAMVTTHSFKSGYMVKPDNKSKVEVKDIAAFMKWLKTNKTSSEVFEFFKDAMKITKLKSFCEKEANEQRINGEISPSVDGIEFGAITYRRLTTVRKEQKK